MYLPVAVLVVVLLKNKLYFRSTMKVIARCVVALVHRVKRRFLAHPQQQSDTYELKATDSVSSSSPVAGIRFGRSLSTETQ
jgi:hypothetical protein